MLNPEQGSCKYQVESHWFDPTRNQTRAETNLFGSDLEAMFKAYTTLSWEDNQQAQLNCFGLSKFECFSSMGAVVKDIAIGA